MGQIHVHEFMTLDGVIDAPMWVMDFGFVDRQDEIMRPVCDACSGILLGRNTYEMFEPAWSTRTVEDDPGAPFFNETRKHVVSSTLTDPTWNNSEVVGPYDPAAIQRLKDESEGNLYVSGSAQLVRALLADGLVDELHLFVYPITRGAGPQLFAQGDAPAKFEVATSEALENQATYLNLRPAA